jgi:hypothetical protein
MAILTRLYDPQRGMGTRAVYVGPFRGQGLKKHVHVEWFLIVNPCILIYNNSCILILIGKQLYEEYAQ